MNAHPFLSRIADVETVARRGRVLRIMATHVEADGPDLPLRSICALDTGAGPATLKAEIARVDRDTITLVPLEHGAAIPSGAAVTALGGGETVPVGDALLGRAVDGLGRPTDGKKAIYADHRASLAGADTAALDRVTPRDPFVTGVRAIDGLLTLGRGQRVGIFAASGVGKTSLINQLGRQAAADRCVFCLVGERGREVESLWLNNLSDEARARSVMVSATSDQPAAMRVRAGEYAATIAEHWRAEGHHVLLIVDSISRLAMALREVGLAAGEPPTVRAYTPNVFAAIPKLIERCGALKSGGAITALMTILSETDDVDDPLAEMMKSLLDGHIVLSRSLAEQGHFPAIDAPKSVSRLARDLAEPPHRAAARKVLAQLSTYENSRLLIDSGIYVAGSRTEIDAAIARKPLIDVFLRQEQDEQVPFEKCAAALIALAEARS